MPLNIASSLVSTLVRATSGIQSSAAGERPAELVQLYAQMQRESSGPTG